MGKLNTFLFLAACTFIVQADYPAEYPPKNQRITGFACENSFITLRCTGEGERIRILRANYGRFSLVICNQGGVSEGWDLKCISTSSTNVVESRCGGRSNCTVFANNKEFGDPCPGTKKYIEIRYFCEKAKEHTTPKEIDIPKTTSLIPIETESTPKKLITTTQSSDGETTTTSIPVILTTPSPRKTTKTKTTSTPRNTSSPSDGGYPSKQTDVKTCDEMTKDGIQWTRTETGKSDEKPCPDGLVGTAVWRCGKNGRWMREPDLSNCISPWMEEIEAMLDNEKEVEVAMETLNSKIKGRKLGSGDLKKAAVGILPNMVKRMKLEVSMDMPFNKKREKVHSFSKEIVKSGSSLLEDKQKSSWEGLDSEDRKKSATCLIVSLEKMALEVAATIEKEDTVTSAEQNIVMEVSVLKLSKQRNMKLPRNQYEEATDGSQPHFNLPLDGISGLITTEKVTLTYMFYNNLESLMSPDGLTESSSSTSKTRVVNSNVISASIYKHSNSMDLKTNRRIQLSKPMNYTVPTKSTYNDRQPVCAFWKYNDSTLIGEWSDEGCHVVLTTDKYTTCECNHLTNFAVLMDVSGTKLHSLHRMTLQAITYVGCTVSIMCLIMCLVSFCMFRNLQSDRNTIHKNLVLCLMIAELLFLFGIGQTQDKAFCSVIAGFLHFFFLASFSWMCLEGVQLYFMLIVVFEARRYKWFYGFGYGVPAVIVAVSAAIDHTGYGTEFHCWLRTDNYFILSFVIPAAIVIMINIVMLSIAVYTMCRHAGVTARRKGKMEKMAPCDVNSKHDSVCDCEEQNTPLELPTWLKGSAVLVVLLGLTWTFGLMYVSEDTIVMAYLFTILNSLQGLFIFIFHCFMDKKVKKEWRRAIYKAKWLPMCCRVNIGGNGDTVSSPTPSYSSGIPNYFLRFWSSRKRKRSSTSSATAKHRRSDLDSFLRTDSSSGCTTGTGVNRYSNQSEKLLLNGQNVYTAMPTHHEGGINGDLSVIDCSVVDSENVTEYCQQQMNVSNEPRRYSSGSEDMDVQDNISRDSTSRNRLSFLSTDSNLKITSEFNSDTEDGKVNYAVVDCNDAIPLSNKPQPTEKEQNLINDILNLYENTKEPRIQGDQGVSISHSEIDTKSELETENKDKTFTRSAPDLKLSVHNKGQYSNSVMDTSTQPLLGSLPDVSTVGEDDSDTDNSPYSMSADGRIKH